MLTYSLLRLGPASSASGTPNSTALSIQPQLEYALKEVLCNLFSLVRDHPKQDFDDLIDKIDHLFIHSDSSEGSKGWAI